MIQFNLNGDFVMGRQIVHSLTQVWKTFSILVQTDWHDRSIDQKSIMYILKCLSDVLYRSVTRRYGRLRVKSSDGSIASVFAANLCALVHYRVMSKGSLHA